MQLAELQKQADVERTRRVPRPLCRSVSIPKALCLNDNPLPVAWLCRQAIVGGAVVVAEACRNWKK